MTNSNIMIVDDSAEDRLLLEALLDDKYDKTLCESSDEALSQLDKGNTPDILILDVEMPGTNGYETLKKIRENSAYNDIDAIFLSSHNSTEEIIRGYDVGAVEYITKPCDADVLEKKLQRVLAQKANRQQLKSQAEAANQLVQTVMSESGSLGNVMNFLRASFSVTKPEELLQLMLETISNFGLQSAVYANTPTFKEMVSSQGDVSMLEIELLERFNGYKQPFFEKSGRLFVIQNNLVLFIKNMPEETEKHGSIKDNLKILLEGATAKLEYFDQRAQRSNQRAESVGSAMMKALSDLDEIQQLEAGHKKQSLSILEDMVGTVEEVIISMALTEEQENELIDILQTSIIESQNHMNAGLELDERVKNTVIELTNAAKQATQ